MTKEETRATAQALVETIFDQIDNKYLAGRLEVAQVSSDTFLAYEKDGVQLADMLAAYGDPALDRAVYRELDGVIDELRQRAREDEREYRFMTTRPYSY